MKAFEMYRGTCAPTSGAFDIRLDVTTLASIYLGGVAPSTLARAGLIEGRPEALTVADELFSWPIAPWCPKIF